MIENKLCLQNKQLFSCDYEAKPLNTIFKNNTCL